MRKGDLARPIVALLLMAAGSLPAATASAAAQRGSPVRANDLAAAISRAAAGDVIVVDGGRLAGALVVRKTVTLRGRNNPVIDGGGRGTVVTLAAPGIVFSGFIVTASGDNLLDDDTALMIAADGVIVEDTRIDDALHGIYVLRANRFRLLRNRIRGKPFLTDENRGNGIHLHVASDGVIDRNDIAEVRDGVYFNYADRNLIARNRAARLRYGLHYMWSNFNRFVANEFIDSVGGAALMYSHAIVFEGNTFARQRGFRAHGVLFKDVENCQATGNRFLDNTEGITLDGAIRNEFTGNLLAGNDAAVVEYGNSEGNTFVGNAFVGNGTELREIGQESASRWDDGRRGNYWSGYDGYDLDGDGVGERPYRLQNLFEYLEGQRPVLRLLAYGPAAAAVRKAEDAFPVLRQRQTVDAHPLMRMPADMYRLARGAALPATRRGPLALASLLMLAAGCALIVAGRAVPRQ
jgi:nitrous oxidase accessory protein